MNPRLSRRVMHSIIVLALVIPVLVMFINLELGAALLILGLIIAAGASRALGAVSARSLLNDPLFDREQLSRSERGHTIYVQVTDDHGFDLAPGVAEQKLAAARRSAGPRDMVIAVRGRVTPGSTPGP